MKQIVCPVALHPDGDPRRIALVQGQTLPPFTEFTHDAVPTAARHLFSQLGIETRSAIPIGMSTDIMKGCAVHFILCRVAPPVRPLWKHQQPNGTLVTGHWVDFDTLPPNGLTRWIKATL